jgi:Aldo/keto reductase family
VRPPESRDVRGGWEGGPDVGVIACVANTADVYGPHTNEILIHDALHPYPNELVIATKVGFVRGGYDYSTLGAVGNPHYLRQSAHMSARRLGVEQIDLYYLHSGTATDVPFADQVATLAELREQGLDGGGARSGSRFASTAAAPGRSSSLAARSRPLVVARSGSGHYMSAESITKALTTPLQEPEDVIGVAHAA